MKRQSDVLMLKVTPGEQLHEALIEIEDLTGKLDEQRRFYDSQVRVLIMFYYIFVQFSKLSFCLWV